MYTVGVPTLFPPDPLTGSKGASGSGCEPGAGDLPGGVWFGYVRQANASGIAFDLACFFFGDAAYVEGGADGVEVDDDYYVRNVNPTLRSVAVPSAATVHHIDATGDLGFMAVQFADWPPPGFSYIPCPGDFCGVWLYVNGGTVTEIVEQYVP